jgi:hypothetical protein
LAGGTTEIRILPKRFGDAPVSSRRYRLSTRS